MKKSKDIIKIIVLVSIIVFKINFEVYASLAYSPEEGSKIESFIEKNNDEATDGEITTAMSIQPYQTYWHKENSYMQTAFKTIEEGTSYYDLLILQGSNTNYWLASRCINTGSNLCSFVMRYVGDGSVNAYGMYGSYGDTNKNYYALFPVVSLNASLITGDSTNGFTVKTE